MQQSSSDLADTVRRLTVGIVGGTGDQGHGLARRFALAGLRVLIGSRDAGRAAARAADLDRAHDGAPGRVAGATNADICAAADLVIIAVPYDGHAETVRQLRGPLTGKIVVDCVNPLGFDARGPFPIAVPEGSA